jgi:hypothetical protein
MIILICAGCVEVWVWCGNLSDERGRDKPYLLYPRLRFPLQYCGCIEVDVAPCAGPLYVTRKGFSDILFQLRKLPYLGTFDEFTHWHDIRVCSRYFLVLSLSWYSDDRCHSSSLGRDVAPRSDWFTTKGRLACLSHLCN